MTSTVAAELPQVKVEETAAEADHASGLAVAQHGPLVPDLHKHLSDPGGTAASSNTSAALAPAPATVWQRKKREEQAQGALLQPSRMVFIKCVFLLLLNTNL